jgi:cytoskeletal protein RodZ
MNPEDEKTVPLKRESVPDPSEPFTALAALRTIRIARGLSIQDVAVRLKFAPRQVDAFEAQRWDELPKGIGLRTLAKNYSKLLGIDADALEPLLRDYLQDGSSGIANHTSTRSIGGPMQERSAAGSTGWILLIVAVVAVVVGIAFWQDLVPGQFMPSWLKD